MILVSTYQSTADEGTNLTNFLQEMGNLDAAGIQFRVANGYWKGGDELTFLIKNKEVGRALAETYNQDAYLERGHYGYWYLIDTASGRVIDWFKSIVEVKDTAGLDCYTELGGKYYVGVKA